MNKILRNSLIAVFALLCGTVFAQGEQQNVFSQFEITSGTISESEDGNQVIFDFDGLAEKLFPIKGHFVYEFENNLCTSGIGSIIFPEDTSEAILQLAKSVTEAQGYSDVKIEGNVLSGDMSKDFLGISKITLKSMLKLMISPDEQQGYGTLDAPLSPNMANVMAGMLEKDAVTDYDVFVKGKIASIKNEFSAKYGTAVFFISVDGENDFTFQCYSVYYLENKPWVDGNTQIKVGDEVIVCGKLTNFKGNTPETASKQAYIYSLNGVTKNEGGQDPQPSDEVKKVTIAEFNAAEESTDVWYQLTGIVKNLKDGDKYGNFDLEDETGSVYVYGLLSEKGGEKKKFHELAAAMGIKEGSKLTIIGNRGSYNDKIEVMNAYFVSIETSTGISNVKTTKADGVIYNLAGQRVEKATKGIFIQNGKKFMVK